MNKRKQLILPILLVLLIPLFFQSDTEADVDLEKGTEVMIFYVEKLQAKVKATPTNTEKINELGKTLDENWDMIEKQVEKKYPDKYKVIEESLYPLITKAKSDSPDIDELKQLLKETKTKFITFKKTITS